MELNSNFCLCVRILKSILKKKLLACSSLTQCALFMLHSRKRKLEEAYQLHKFLTDSKEHVSNCTLNIITLVSYN